MPEEAPVVQLLSPVMLPISEDCAQHVLAQIPQSHSLILEALVYWPLLWVSRLQFDPSHRFELQLRSGLSCGRAYPPSL